ncbi:PilT protein domain protein [Stanieria cyanosphaera PCC 7437]|uniref:PilT protein domain protein n=1 Tax=Stanieria cyanosphaera (strain ATCC 29371 / PCC 7437) TaxID=111780 RepID=K9Y0U1_STAC7|nr:type II toxin-antitoxin system VapC family toxin [Stanieria cyanosphaera]AFZ37929.1 PilT protein domain protein [Stanieria cyanosphaera PCC 7437]
MYLLDTDTLTHLYHGNSNVARQLAAVEDVDVGITIITKVEILRGRIDRLLKADAGANLLKAQELLFRTEELLNQLLIVPISQAASLEFERLNAVSKYRKIGRADLLIASIILANRATLVTRNKRHFQQIPGLKIENWVD